MKIYAIEMKVCATAYVRAESPGDALRTAAGLALSSPAIQDAFGTVPVSGKCYSSPDLPDVSLSPAMTIWGIWDGAKAEQVE